MTAVDCHAHVFGGPEYAFAPEAAYRPIPAEHGTAQSFLAVLDAHGLTHGLAVSAQPYGRDNRCMLDAVAGANGRLKGVALVHAEISDRELAALADGGVVGIRVNLNTYGMRELQEPGMDRLLARIREMKWFLQVHSRADQLVEAGAGAPQKRRRARLRPLRPPRRRARARPARLRGAPRFRPVRPRARQAVGAVPVVATRPALRRRRPVRPRRDRRVHARPLRLGVGLAVRQRRDARRLRARLRVPRTLAARSGRSRAGAVGHTGAIARFLREEKKHAWRLHRRSREGRRLRARRVRDHRVHGERVRARRRGGLRVVPLRRTRRPAGRSARRR